MGVGTTPTLLQNYTWLLFIDRNGENKRDSSGERHQRVNIYSTTKSNEDKI
jgi:hypothetical protein